jgi:hypothetical protein
MPDELYPDDDYDWLNDNEEDYELWKIVNLRI